MPVDDVQTVSKTKTKIKEPSMYRVVLLNDDFTPMVFVIEILMAVFNKSAAEAQALTLEVHTRGRGVAGIYTKEIAEQKADDTLAVAAHYSHPLKVVVEPN
jgi:ATP-dependent Clp protease adaptor protein ClpS